MLLAIGFLFIIIIGYLLLDLFTSDLVLEEKLSLSYGMGMGFISLLMFLLFYFKFLNSEKQLIISMFLISILLFVIRLVIKKVGITNVKHIRKGVVFCEYSFFKQLNYKLYLVILPLFILSFVFAYYYPIIITDGNDYEVTGRLIALNGSIEPESFLRPYPPLIPLAYSFVYFLGGTHPKIIFSLFYLSLVLCFYFRLIASRVNRSVSLIFTLILATTPYMWWHSFLGILNLTAAYYFSIATLFWFSCLQDIPVHRDGYLNYSHPLLAGIFYGFSIFTRFEMLVYFLIPLTFTAIYSLKYRLTKILLCLVLPPLFISSCWSFFSINELVSGDKFKVFYIAIIILILTVVLTHFIISKKESFKLIKFIDKCEMQILSLMKAIGIGFAIILIVYHFIPQDMSSDLHFSNQALFFIKTLVTKSITFLLGNIFFLSTSLLVMILPAVLIKNKDFKREHIYLFVFIIAFLILNIIMFSYLYFFNYLSDGCSITRNYDLREFLKTFVYQPGQVVNNVQIRGLLPIYPIIIFFFAISGRVRKAFEV